MRPPEVRGQRDHTICDSVWSTRNEEPERVARTHGWDGRPPADDEEAIERILDATRRCIERDGARATVSEVAAELGVTRQTVYRYFDSTEKLLHATAFQASGPFLDRLTRHLRKIDEPAEAVVE